MIGLPCGRTPAWRARATGRPRRRRRRRRPRSARRRPAGTGSGVPPQVDAAAPRRSRRPIRSSRPAAAEPCRSRRPFRTCGLDRRSRAGDAGQPPKGCTGRASRRAAADVVVGGAGRCPTRRRAPGRACAPGPWLELVALPADTNATRLPSGETAMSTASTMPASAGPLCVVPSGETMVTAGWTMPLHGSAPP